MATFLLLVLAVGCTRQAKYWEVYPEFKNFLEYSARLTENSELAEWIKTSDTATLKRVHEGAGQAILAFESVSKHLEEDFADYYRRENPGYTMAALGEERTKPQAYSGHIASMCNAPYRWLFPPGFLSHDEEKPCSHRAFHKATPMHSVVKLRTMNANLSQLRLMVEMELMERRGNEAK